MKNRYVIRSEKRLDAYDYIFLTRSIFFFIVSFNNSRVSTYGRPRHQAVSQVSKPLRREVEEIETIFCYRNPITTSRKLPKKCLTLRVKGYTTGTISYFTPRLPRSLTQSMPVFGWPMELPTQRHREMESVVKNLDLTFPFDTLGSTQE